MNGLRGFRNFEGSGLWRTRIDLLDELTYNNFYVPPVAREWHAASAVLPVPGKEDVPA